MKLRLGGALLGGITAIIAATSHVGHAADFDRPGEARTQPHKRELVTIQDIHDTFFRCWRPPPRDLAWAGTAITVRFSLARDGEVIGEPRVTFDSIETPPEARVVYQRTVMDAFRTCTPFNLSAQLGDAIAGRPTSLHLSDGRGQTRTSNNGS